MKSRTFLCFPTTFQNSEKIQKIANKVEYACALDTTDEEALINAGIKNLDHIIVGIAVFARCIYFPNVYMPLDKEMVVACALLFADIAAYCIHGSGYGCQRHETVGPTLCWSVHGGVPCRLCA